MDFDVVFMEDLLIIVIFGVSNVEKPVIGKKLSGKAELCFLIWFSSLLDMEQVIVVELQDTEEHILRDLYSLMKMIMFIRMMNIKMPIRITI